MAFSLVFTCEMFYDIQKTMVISCPQCSTRFKVPDEKLKQGAMKVRCSKCKNIFTASGDSATDTAPGPSLRPKGDVNLDFDIGDDPAPVKMPPAPPPVKPIPKPPAFNIPERTDLLSGDSILDIPTAKQPPRAAEEKKPLPVPPPATVPEFVTGGLSFEEEEPVENLFGDAQPKSDMQKIDDELNVLLDTPVFSPSSENADHDIPLTMPADIDLSTLAPKKNTPGKKKTDDGIELLDDIRQMDEKPARMPSLGERKEPPLSSAQKTKSQMPALASSMDSLIEPYDETLARRSSFNFKKVFGAILILAAIAGGTFLLTSGTVDLAVVKTFFASQVLTGPGDAENKGVVKNDTQISVLNTSALFLTTVDNRKTLVISGEVRNGYPIPHSFIRVKVHLSNAQGQPLSEKEVFAGNFFSREEIYLFPDQNTVDGKYSDSGKSLSNLNVQPNATIPFQMIIFDPDPLWEQFRVEASGSQAASQGS